MNSKLNSKVFYYYNRISRLLKKKKIDYNKVSKFDYEQLINNFNIKECSDIFIHGGLKGIKQLSNQSYDIIVDNIIFSLQKCYKPSALIAPSFTPSFRKSGVYSKQYSKAEYGLFSELFRIKSKYRTNDAIHSVSLITNDFKKFINMNYNDTFSKDGFYASLIKNAYIINISTEHFVSTYMHYIEEDMKVPYKKSDVSISGIMYDDDNNILTITQKNHEYKYNTAINRNKVNKLLIKENVIEYKTYLGVTVSCIKVSELDFVLRQAIKKDPYFLVTF